MPHSPPITLLSLVLTQTLSIAPAWAAETILLKYKLLRESVAVADLQTLAQTGEVKPALAAHLKLANQRPDSLRHSLTQTVEVNPRTFDRVLNSPVGNLLLDQLGQTFRNPAGVADRQALRAALTLSAQDDGKLTLLEVMEKYPLKEMLVDGDRLAQTYRQLRDFANRIKRPLGGLGL